MKTDEIDDVGWSFTLSSWPLTLLLESSAHALRLLLELLTAPTERRAWANFDVLFLAFVLAGTLQSVRIFPAAPSFVMAAMFVRIEAYEFLMLTVLAASLAVHDRTYLLIVTIIFAALQLESFSPVSNVLRSAATTALFVSWFIADVDTMRYACVLALELASWATERSMLPWRVREAQTWGFWSFRFFLGFVVGVHISDATDEHVHPFSFRRIPTIVGVAVYEDRVFLRYRATPFGILLAYLEGILARPIHGIMSCGAITFSLYGIVPLVTWSPGTSKDACAPLKSFACASRFPIRRIVLGILLRLASNNMSITL